MPKKPLEKKVRRALLIVLILFFIVSVYGLFYTFSKPSGIEKSIPTCNYQQKGEFTYLVKVKPNSIYAEPVLGPGKIYFTKLVDQINVYLNYHFSVDKMASQIKGVYEIVAIVDAPEMWQKNYVLVPPTELSTEGKTLSLRKEFPVNLAYFNEVLKQTNEEVGIAARDPKLNIKANIYLQAVTAEGAVNETLNPTMSIPLTTGDFKIGGELTAKKEGSLTNTMLVTDSALKWGKALMVFCSIILGLLLVLSIKFTENKVIEIDERKAMIDSIKKKYGERMVMVHDEILPAEKASAITIDSMEDLVKVADELGKPIISRNPVNYDESPTYYVFDSLMAYKHTLNLNP